MINLSSSTPFDFNVLEKVWKVKHVFLYIFKSVWLYDNKRFKFDSNWDMKMMSLTICYKILKKKNKYVEVILNLTSNVLINYDFKTNFLTLCITFKRLNRAQEVISMTSPSNLFVQLNTYLGLAFFILPFYSILVQAKLSTII
jgi:hypothetical protein